MLLRQVLLGVGMMTALPLQAVGAEPTPLTYELMINGESFLVEGDRAVKLASKERPGTTYDVAIRVAPTQQLRLGPMLVEHDRLAKVERTGNQRQPGVKMTHELGYTMLLTTLGEPFDTKQQDEALGILAESAVEVFKKMKVEQIEVDKAHERKFAGVSAKGVAIRYRDEQGYGHTSLVYVLTGPKFTASCVTQYLDNDAEDVLPLIKRTLDSLRTGP